MGPVLCVDVCTELNLVVSGSTDRMVLTWDIRQAKLLRSLGPHSGPIRSVSINTINGSIVVVTCADLTLYSANGDFVATTNFEKIKCPSGTVGLAPPHGMWQDGVVAVTGHVTGYVVLWKLFSRLIETDCDEATEEGRGVEIGLSVKVEEGSGASEGSPLRRMKRRRIVRDLMVACVPPKTHDSDVSCLRLSSVSSPSATKVKPAIVRCYEGGNSLELLVGDIDGWISRWAPVRLENLPPNEIQQIFNQHFMGVHFYNSSV